jgi:hypothetical protein
MSEEGEVEDFNMASTLRLQNSAKTRNKAFLARLQNQEAKELIRIECRPLNNSDLLLSLALSFG